MLKPKSEFVVNQIEVFILTVVLPNCMTINSTFGHRLVGEQKEYRSFTGSQFR